jgi:putative DNA primase/helicase
VVAGWWRRWPDANIGILTGKHSGFVVLDVDISHDGVDGIESLRQLRHRYGGLPETRSTITGSGGYHLLFRHPGGERILPNVQRLDDLPGLDIRGDGGYIVAPPSMHASGARYEWENDEESAELPDWLMTLLERPQRAKDTPRTPAPRIEGDQAQETCRFWLDQALAKVSEGTRNHTGFWLACQLRDSGVPEEMGEETLDRYAEGVPGEGYSLREAQMSCRSAYRQAPREKARSKTPRVEPTPIRPDVSSPRLSTPPRAAASPSASPSASPGGSTAASPAPSTVPSPAPSTQPSTAASPAAQAEPALERKVYPHTEMGNAERLLDRHGANIRYCKALDFCVWDGKRWRPEGELVVRSWAKETIRAIYQEGSDLSATAAKTEDEAERKRLASEAQSLLEWARRSERAQMVGAMLKIIMPECQIDVAEFDSKPMLFNCASGTVDLRTGELREHRRDDYLMQWSPVKLDAAVPILRFLKFISQIMLGRQSLVDYLQRTLGYCLTGDVGEQVWHLLYGEGENGKSVLMETIEAVLGQYAGTMEPESITVNGAHRDGGAASPDIAALKGVRLVKITETEEGARIAPARIKKLSGGDKLTARFLHRDIFEFQPTGKLFIYTNHKPQTREMTHAYWRRVRLVPFDFNASKLPAGEKDPDLREKLIAEAPGILAWLVQGCLEWQRIGLNPPAEVLEATASYKSEMDIVGKFIEECCVVGVPYQATAKALWARWREWCEENNEREGNRRNFGIAISKRPEQFEGVHTRDGNVWTGIGLIEAA